MGVFAYYDPDTDATVYHVIPSPESDHTPSSFGSETSTSSGATIQSDDLPGYFVLHHGRQQPANPNFLRWFPPDNIRRLIIRYLVSTSIFGGDYVGPVREILAPVDGKELRALELGTRTGTWVQSMATQFPHVQWRTLDLVPVIAHIPRPNITFEVYDFTEHFMLEDNSQDAVFLNVVLEMVRDYRALLREAYRVLRPGGLIHINDFNPNFWDPSDLTKIARRTNPRGCSLVDLVRQRLVSIGVDPETCEKIPQWLAPGSDLWADGQKGFGSIQSVRRMYPAFPHDGFPCMGYMEPNIVPYVRYLIVASVRDMSGLVKDTGIGDEIVDTLTEDTLKELNSHDSCIMLKIYCLHAIKL